jgi:hypothetical protein
MTMPMDGKNFFASDVMHSAFSGVMNGCNSSSDDGSDGRSALAGGLGAAQAKPPTLGLGRTGDSPVRLAGRIEMFGPPRAKTPAGGAVRVAGKEEKSWQL